MMTKERILERLAYAKAVITGSHLVYASGRHGKEYINKDAVYPHTRLTSDLCQEIAHEFENEGVEVVAAPAVGGVALTQWTAHHLSNGREVLAVYADKEERSVFKVEGPTLFAEVGITGFPVNAGEEVVVRTGHFAFKRGYDKLLKDRKVLVVEDVINTGGSVEGVIHAVLGCGGNVVGVGALCNRGGVTAEKLGVPKLHSLLDINLESWEEADCPLCKENVPINTAVGKGKDFLARKQAAKA